MRPPSAWCSSSPTGRRTTGNRCTPSSPNVPFRVSRWPMPARTRAPSVYRIGARRLPVGSRWRRLRGETRCVSA
jgi:hypothetical protein